MTARERSCRAFIRFTLQPIFEEQAGMTAYLISLALAGLVAIALWEGFS
jgi:hypothetical protein